MPTSISKVLARLAASPVFLVLFLVLGTTVSSYCAGLLAARAGVTIGLVITGVVAFVATYFAYGSRSLEMYLSTGASILVAMILTRISPWWVAFPGAVAGGTWCIILGNAMDAPNQRAAAEEWKRKNEARSKDAG